MPSLFDDWVSDPVEAFKGLIQSSDFIATSPYQMGKQNAKVLSPSSALVYVDMFGKFMRWCTLHHKTLFSVTHADLMVFLGLADQAGQRDLNSKIAFRYLRLLERTYLHLKIVPNPAQHAIFDAVKARRQFGRDEAMVTMNAVQVAKFVDALPLCTIRRTAGTPFAGWKKRRDRAMQACMLGAGLRVAEVMGLLVDEVAEAVDGDGCLAIAIRPEGKHATSVAHCTRLSAAVAAPVLAWRRERMVMQVPGVLLFPANLRGGKLNKSSVYRQVKATFDRAGIAVERAGGRTLRNTFAVGELARGATALELTESLGLALVRSIEVYALAGEKDPA